MNEEIKVNLLSDSLSGQWDAYIDKNDLAIAWQRSEWHEILKKHHGHDYFPLVASRKNEICGIFPLYKLNNKAFRSRLISVPFAVAGGIVADSAEIEEKLLEGALALAKEKGTASLVLKQYKHKIDADLFTDDNFYNRELSINMGVDRLWAGLADVNKSMISSANESGLTLEFPSRNIDDFYRVLFSYNHRQGIPCVSKQWIMDLVESSMYSCALVRQGGRVVAGTLVKCFKQTVSLPFTALARADKVHHQTAYWLYWQLISAHAKLGYEIFHSGRIPNNESVPDFRLGWNGTKYPYFYQYHPNVARATEFSQKRGIKRRLFSRVWRFLPKPAASFFSPYIIRKFP
jgi:hypothetical protein